MYTIIYTYIHIYIHNMYMYNTYIRTYTHVCMSYSTIYKLYMVCSIWCASIHIYIYIWYTVGSFLYNPHDMQLPNIFQVRHATIRAVPKMPEKAPSNEVPWLPIGAEVKWLPLLYPLVNKHSYGKWPFIVDFHRKW